ncbi:MAG: outer membrane beta-barrel protein [Bacteroidota bacterium]|nr:outer membrane beta-barrel protein [Bacteroidota bacterium]
MIKYGYLTLVLLLLSTGDLLGQARVPAWGGGADLNDLSFGFSFSYVSSYYKIDKKTNWRDPFFDAGTNRYITDPLTGISSANSPGFAIGFITRYRITDHLETRVNPSLVFSDRSLSYTYADLSKDVTKQVQATTIDFPLSIKLKSDRIQDFRAYILGGLKYSLAIGSKNQDPNIDPLARLVKNVGGFGSYEAGLGCDIYFEFFKLSPEIKVSNSFGDMLIHDNQPYSSPINKLGLHTVMFSLIFE